MRRKCEASPSPAGPGKLISFQWFCPLEQGWRAAATDGKTSLSRSLRLAHFSAARASANAALAVGPCPPIERRTFSTAQIFMSTIFSKKRGEQTWEDGNE